MWNTIWKILNSNLVILLLGSGLGFLFVRLVWEPYKQRQEENSRRRTMREEALFRLFFVESQILSCTQGINNQLDGFGDYVRSLNPIYRNWSLEGLIFVGWGKDVLNKCYPHISWLRRIAETGIDKVQDKEQALDALLNLKKILET